MLSKVVFGGMLTMAGILLDTVVPSPSCPKLLRPQAHTLPFWSMASECLAPVDTDSNVVLGGMSTRTGSGRSVVVPSPSCPTSLRPQAQALPFWSIASECCAPPLMATKTVLAGIDTALGATRVTTLDPSPT